MSSLTGLGIARLSFIASYVYCPLSNTARGWLSITPSKEASQRFKEILKLREKGETIPDIITTLLKKLMEKILEKLNKLSLPATILIASVILGGFYFASQINKQISIERQQQIKLQEEQRLRDKRSDCSLEAGRRAQKHYKETCVYDCREGWFDVSVRNDFYEICLRNKGL